MRIIRRAAAWGAIVGIGIAVLMILLDHLGPFSVRVNGFLDRVTFRLCPLFILGFWKSMKSWPELILITIVGNALLYGILFMVIASVIALILLKKPDPIFLD